MFAYYILTVIFHIENSREVRHSHLFYILSSIPYKVVLFVPTSEADSEKTILTHRDFIILASEWGKTRNKDRDYPLTSAMTSVSVSALAGIH